MGKKHKKPQLPRQPAPPTEAPSEPISSRGKGTIGIGIGTLAAGFIVLSFADPMGSNWAARIAPFLILGGYVLAGIGIFLPEAGPAQGPQAGPSSETSLPLSGPGKNQ